MVTGLDPGTLGIYGFTDRANRSYEQRRLSTSEAVQAPCLWHYLAAANIPVRLLAVPQTYPPPYPALPKQVMVAGHPYPPNSAPAVSPADYPLQEALQAHWQVDHLHYRQGDQAQQVNAWQQHSQGILQQLCYWLSHEPDVPFVMAVDMGPDRLHHLLWQDAFPQGNCQATKSTWAYQTLLHYYQWWDGALGRLQQHLDADDTLLLISDHGAQAMTGGFLINQWLLAHGWLTLRQPANGVERLDPEQIDWQRTYAWADGGFVGRIYFNVQQRESQGQLTYQQLPAFKARLTTELQAWAATQAQPISLQVLAPDTLYQQQHGIAPDLLIEINNLTARVLGTIGYEPQCFWQTTNDRGPDGANHSKHGIYMIKGPNIAPGSKALAIYDIAPSILAHFALPIPTGLRGELGFAPAKISSPAQMAT